MDKNIYFVIALLLMAGVTYLIRMVPLVLVNKKIESPFIRSLLYYVPYAILTAMTVPAIFYQTGSVYTAALGALVAVALAYRFKNLLLVSGGAALTVLIGEIIISLIA